MPCIGYVEPKEWPVYTPKESSNAYTFVLAFSGKPELRFKKYFGIQ